MQRLIVRAALKRRPIVAELGSNPEFEARLEDPDSRECNRDYLRSGQQQRRRSDTRELGLGRIPLTAPRGASPGFMKRVRARRG
jgi:hypothetical protein